MSSEKRIQASRANGAKSRGPKTLQGKRNSSQNARRHGLLSSLATLQESDQALDQIRISYQSRFGALDPVETVMVEQMARTFWRVRRSWALENSLFDTAPDGSAIAQLGLLQRYETALQGKLERGIRDLILRRKTRAEYPEITKQT